LEKIPEITRIASAEFQEFIKKEDSKWDYHFATQRGKMFRVLVVKSKAFLRFLLSESKASSLLDFNLSFSSF